ncbi:uncharacterized protein [Procambarus clarkii]|uniref:uncharacterized protein n=1 Tax=Procambarus clarkii TaxID=6728 RepID=UPI001E67669F|nr:uncharacterized protein LOC123774170 [Procambarus clarkii]XP_045624254.1 uncharacterized protein LOC123774170 [Procambarus clarkii]XP_045624255.1 uncharacterized protein LOC123774170 [Procambarus clarkii]XP_045624256.1 uncharacterized protein LOC123774170 [Procambarus clarkii]XP_045624258.1 uncharacterized protein LOC123774170 [Procambarus clarkii]XP_045624259.1 uncharacterized protein LOC123774170 [Procambarus clarkii]XP_045624260.1 uncharacterized protein LOC123774170 [Procambarus clarki
MKVAPAPAGDPRPVAAPGPSSRSEIDLGDGAPLPSNATTDATPNSGREDGGRWAAAVLLLTHVVELAAMVAAILSHALPLHQLPEPTYTPPELSLLPGNTSEVTPESGQESRVGVWGHVCLPLQLAVAIAPLVVITAISLVWAVRAQDFSGRRTARMLCWLLHCLQASILWRFLKVHLAFDPSDVAELGTLRFVQVHVHTLPFLVLHVTIMVKDSDGFALVSVIVAAAMVVSIVVTIVVATTASHSSRPSSLTPPTITQVAHTPIHGAATDTSHESHDVAVRGVVAVTTSCVVWSRVAAVAALFCLHVTWACVLVALHWLAALLWLSLQQELEPTTLGPVRKALRRAFLAYLLLWDFHVFRDDASAMTVCARPRLPAAYYSITALQNVAVTATWYTTSRAVQPAARIAILSSMLAAQAVALLLLALSYLYCSSLLPSWPRNKTSALTRTASLVTPCVKPQAPPSTDTHDRNSYVDFKEVEGEEFEVNKDTRDEEHSTREVVTPQKAIPPMAHSTPRTPIPLAPRLMTAHLPPTMFSFSHDILPLRLAKSERSSTDNGSFNSRNTNTLPTQLPPEYNLRRAHGSFSDSFSSLSCGTISRTNATVRTVVTHDPRAQRTPPPFAKQTFASHSSCRSGYCHCKLFDGIEGSCDANEEEEDRENYNKYRKKAASERDSRKEGVGVITNDHPVQGGTNSVGLLPGSSELVATTCDSAPRVAMVRGIQRFRVVCAACLHAHDPLLTRCHAHASQPEALFTLCHAHTLPSEAPLSPSCHGVPLVQCSTATFSRSCVGLGGGSSTDYPSDTEVTATADTLSSASADSHSTYTTWPVARGPGMARLLQLHPGSHDYVTAWLRHQQARGPRLPPAPPQAVHHSSHSTSPELMVHQHRRPRIHLPRPSRQKDPALPHLLQDLETVV